jgi:hypothetical protein
MGANNSYGAYRVDPEDYDNPYSGGLLGRLLARQAELGQYEPTSGSDVGAPLEPRDSNFRRLARVYITDRAPDRVDADRSDSYLNQGNASDTGAPAPTFQMAQLALQGRMPVPPFGPVPQPPISMPAIPDWWKAAGALSQLYLHMLAERGRGGSIGVDGENGAEGSSGATVLNARKRRAPGKPAETGKESDDEDGVYDHAANLRRIDALRRDREATFSNQYDPKNYCEEQFDRDFANCGKRRNDYLDKNRDYYACLERAQELRSACYANGGRPVPGLKPWGLGDEEVDSRDYMDWQRTLRPK